MSSLFTTFSDAARRRVWLVLALAFVAGCRLVLYAWAPDWNSAFDTLYDAAGRLVRGDNPYPAGNQSVYYYPLPAALLAVPFTAIPLPLARLLFDILAGWAFVYALWKHRGLYALLAIGSGAYLFALASGQTTPLMVAASLVPALGFLLAVKPHTAAALWIARPSWITLAGAAAFVALGFLVLPSWLLDWWTALPPDTSDFEPPILRPFGFVLLLAALRWRLPEGRLLFAIAFVPQTALPYELVPLALIPANRLEMLIYLAGSWIAVAAAGSSYLSQILPRSSATEWLVALVAVYLPMLGLVLRRPGGRIEPGPALDRRRRNRLPDDELEVDVSSDGEGGVVVTVIHLPTRLSATESGQSRKPVERKAHDKLAAILADKRNAKGRSSD